jgi:Family of unknown function (DUF5706)
MCNGYSRQRKSGRTPTMSDEMITMRDIDNARSILNHNQNLLNFLDAKAGVLLAVDGAILVILATSPAAITPGLEQLALGAALLLIGISAIFGFLIIKPRVYKGNTGTKIFYSAILSQTREGYKGSFSSTPKEMLDDYLDNIYTLALIEKKKFFYLQESLYCLLLGLVPLIFMIVVVH